MAISALGSRLTVDHTFVAMQAVEDGLGVAVLPLLFVARLIAGGRLVAPLPSATAISGTYFLLRRPGKICSDLETFSRWLIKECGGDQR